MDGTKCKMTKPKGGLTLTRREMETIVIGEQVTVTIFVARNGRARVNIVAPPDVRVVRGELQPHQDAA